VDAEDLAPSAFVGNAHDDLAVEPAGTPQRLIDCFGAVGRGDHDDVGARFQPVHQRQQLRDEALLRLARHLPALRRDRIDLVDEHDRRRGLGGFLEHLPQLAFRFAIRRAHDLGPVDQEEFGCGFVGDRACEAGLAGSGWPVQQNALGRIDAKPLEQFGIAQGQLDHLAELVDRRAHPADVVISDVGTARFLGLLIFGAKLDLGGLVDMHHALGHGRNHRKTDLLQRIGGRAQHVLDTRRHVVDALLPCGRDDVALAQRPPEEGPLERVGRALQSQILLCGREHDAGRCL
jgi:hypothetical protein